MDIRKIRKLIDIMHEADLQSIAVTEGDNSIALTRRTTVAASVAAPQAASLPAAQPTGHVEKSPMVGIFYSAPSPNEPAFVKVGQTVSAGDKIGIIEAMKIMNPIEATADGVIEEIFAKNGEMIAFDQPLFRLRAR